MAIIEPGPGSRRAVFRIKMPHFLLFALKCGSRLKHRSMTDFIIENIQGYSGTGEIKTKEIDTQSLIRHFVRFYPYYLKNKVKAASNRRKFYVITSYEIRENIKRFAPSNDMTMNS
jgi:hypothetical protein